MNHQHIMVIAESIILRGWVCQSPYGCGCGGGGYDYGGGGGGGTETTKLNPATRHPRVFSQFILKRV